MLATIGLVLFFCSVLIWLPYLSNQNQKLHIQVLQIQVFYHLVYLDALVALLIPICDKSNIIPEHLIEMLG
jgi:hypothetical protein